MMFTVLRARKELEMDVDISHQTEVANVERDSDDLVTVYGTESNGQLYYLVIDQELIDKLKSI